MDRAHEWFERHGEAAVFFSRLLPVVRTFISLPAGVARMNFAKFTLYTVLGCLPWSLALAFAGFELGENWHAVDRIMRPFSLLLAVAFAAAAAWWVRRRLRQVRAAGEQSELVDGDESPREPRPTSAPRPSLGRLGRQPSSMSAATDCRPRMDTSMNSSKGTPSSPSTEAMSSRLTPGAKALSFSFFLTEETFMPAARVRADERRGHEQARDAVGVHDRLGHPICPELGMSVRKHAVDHARIHVRLAEPFGGEVGVALGVVPGHVLIEIVEQAGERPRLLRLAEVAGERAHDALDRDQVAQGGLLRDSGPAQRDRGVPIHQPRCSSGRARVARSASCRW